tara:strand:+ start:46 stop:495 length:450 start_codon:yes stop_codon:yes gene_type:complete
LLFISHTPSENTAKLANSCMTAINDVTDDLIIFHKPSGDVVTEDVLNCNGLLLATTENIGYMAGLTKDLFDRCYNEWLGATDGLPTVVYIRAGHDGTATSRALSQIAGGLSWRLIRPPLILKGNYIPQFEEEVAELAGAFAAGLESGLF